MKKILTMLILSAMFFSLMPHANSMDSTSTADTDLVKTSVDQKKIYCNATLADEFEPGVILVVLTKRATQVNKTYKSTHFDGLKTERIEDLSYIENEKAFEWINIESYNQILKITFAKNIDAVKLA